MEWYKNFNYSDIGNNSSLGEENVGAWPHISTRQYFDSNYLFGPSNTFLSAVSREIFKSSLITLISLAGLTRIKSTYIKANVIYGLETCLVLMVALSFYALLAIFLVPFVIYRQLIQTYFTMWKPKCKLMHGTDAFWCMDSVQAKSIINILILLDINDKDGDLLETLTELMVKLCSDPIYGFKFSSYAKKSKTGYFYWEHGNINNIKNNISYINDKITNEKELNQFLSGILNKSIEGFGWEVYISRTDLENNSLRPVVFRMHHSIGDGASILNALINTISDKTRHGFTLSETFNVSFQPRGTDFRFNTPQTEPFQIIKKKIISEIQQNLNKIPILLYGPLNLIRESLRNNEKFKLSVDKLDGNKIIAWYDDENILFKIKSIRKDLNVSFSDVVFSLISNSLQKYLERQGGAPEDISIVVPMFGTQSKSLKIKSEIIREDRNIKVSRLAETDGGMENSFWVSLLQLPIRSESFDLKTKIKLIKDRTDALRRSPDLIMYKFILSIIVTLVPAELVKPMFNMTKTHMVFSNLPGPQNQIKIAGNSLKQISFWLPNRETTGLGLSLLSYNNRLSIGLIADTAVVPTSESLQAIMDDFVCSIHTEFKKIKE